MDAVHEVEGGEGEDSQALARSSSHTHSVGTQRSNDAEEFSREERRSELAERVQRKNIQTLRSAMLGEPGKDEG